MSQRPLLTAEEAKRAIYLDLEGRAGQSPVLLGALWVSRQGQEPMFRQYVLDGAFASAALATGRSATSFAGELKSLMTRAQSQDRVMVGWSEYEVRMVAEFAPEFSGEFDLRYRDARALARHWRKKIHPGYKVSSNNGAKKHSLGYYMALADHAPPAEFWGGWVAKTIAEVRDSLEHRGSYDALSAKQQTRWNDLLGYNEHDCRATRAVCFVALDELAKPELSTARSKKGARARKENTKEHGKKHGKKLAGRVA